MKAKRTETGNTAFRQMYERMERLRRRRCARHGNEYGYLGYCYLCAKEMTEEVLRRIAERRP